MLSYETSHGGAAPSCPPGPGTVVQAVSNADADITISGRGFIVVYLLISELKHRVHGDRAHARKLTIELKIKQSLMTQKLRS
jgi:hypothetical protein